MSEFEANATSWGDGPRAAMEASFDTPGRVSLRVTNASGEVAIETHDVPTAEVQIVALHLDAEELAGRARVSARETSDGHEVSVEIPHARPRAKFWAGDSAAVGVRVRVPCDTELEVLTASACVAAHGMAEGAAEDAPGCRPEALHDAVEPLVRKAVQGVLAGLELATKGGERLSTAVPETGTSQDRDEMARMLAVMVAPVMEGPKRLVYHAALQIAADAYTAGAEAADLLRHEERPAAIQRLYGELLDVGRQWRLWKQAEQN